MAGLHKILLVEDNDQLREMYRIYLEMRGYEVNTAIDGESALEVARAAKPDLVFLDIMMPKMDGLEVLRLLRHDPQYNCSRARIVLMTNLGGNANITPDIRKDMDGYVVKAEIALSDLLEIINSFEQ